VERRQTTEEKHERKNGHENETDTIELLILIRLTTSGNV
jgi:hypothetical protein